MLSARVERFGISQRVALRRWMVVFRDVGEMEEEVGDDLVEID